LKQVMVLHYNLAMSATSILAQDSVPPVPLPSPLVAGDCLSSAEFERRYLAHPEIKKAELLEGVVYLAHSVHYEHHAKPHLYLSGWLGTYSAATSGVEGSNNATVRMDNENEPQPDILLRVDRARGGRSFVGPDDYLVGARQL
jgi:Putative restriction endonuclease